MNIKKALNRDRKKNKTKNGLKIDSKDTSILEEQKNKKAGKLKRKQIRRRIKEKENLDYADY